MPLAIGFFLSRVPLCLCASLGNGFSMLKIGRDDYAALCRHGEETYPHECCGVLLGRFHDAGVRTVTSTVRCGNTRADSPHNRYNIIPANWSAFSARAASAARRLSASTTLTLTTPRAGQARISPKPTGPAVLTSSPAWKKAKLRSLTRLRSPALRRTISISSTRESKSAGEDPRRGRKEQAPKGRKKVAAPILGNIYSCARPQSVVVSVAR